MDNKWVDLNILKYTINKIKELINKKANLKHTHVTSDITEDDTHKFVTKAEKDKVDKIIDTGDGKLVLYNDGNYKVINGSVDDTNLNSTTTTLSSSKINSTYFQNNTSGDGTKFLSDDGSYKATSNSINDSLVGTSSTYSSQKIENALKDKSSITHTHTEFTSLSQNSHTHINKNVLDDISLDRFSKWDEKTNKIITTGTGNKCLTDDGTYKTVTASADWSTQVINKPFDALDTNTLTIDSSKKLTVKRIALTSDEYDALTSTNKIDNNMVYIITDKHLIYYGSIKISGANNSESLYSYLTNTGDGSKYLANNGLYYKINNFGINDTESSGMSTYSSEKIDNKLQDLINNLILPSQNDAPTIWQKTYLNVKNGDILEMVTSESFTIDKVVVQAYKFIAGTTGIVEVLKTFDNSDSSNFYYNQDMVEFTSDADGKMKIKDCYTIENTLNHNGFYESNIINKSDYIEIDHIGAEVRLYD